MPTLTLENYEQILQNEPGHPVFVKLAKALLEQGSAERALEVCAAGMEHCRQPLVLVLACILSAKAKLALGDRPAALAFLRQSTEIIPGDPQAFVFAGALLHDAELFEDAVPFLQHALALKSDDAATAKRLQHARDFLRSRQESAPQDAVPQAPASEPETSPFDQVASLAQEDSDAIPTVVDMSAYVPDAPPDSETAAPAEAPSEEQPAPDTDAAKAENALPAEPDAPLSPFDQAAAWSAAPDNGDDSSVPTMVEVAAYVPETAAPEEAPSDALPELPTLEPLPKLPKLPTLDPLVEAFEPPAADAPNAPEPQTEFPEPAEASAPPQEAKETVEEPEADAPLPAESQAAPEAPAADVPETSPEADAAPAGADAALPFAPEHLLSSPGFSEDQRELSAIFRALDAPEEPPSSETPRSPQTADAAPAGADAAPMMLLSSLLSSPDGMRRTSSEAIHASKGWYAPQDVPEESKPLTPARPAPVPGGLVSAPEADAPADGAPQSEAPSGDEALVLHPENGAAAADHDTAGTPPPLPFPLVRRPTIPPPLKPHLEPKPPALPLTALEKKGGLLTELPEEAVFSSPPRPAEPSVLVTSQTAEEIARQYEKELREQLLQQPPPSFLRRYWILMAALFAAAVVLTAGFYIYKHFTQLHQGDRIAEWRVQSARAIPLATPQAYKDAIELADRILSDFPSDPEAMGIKAFASAALYQRFTHSADDKKAAQDLLDAVRKQSPGLALATEIRLEDKPDAKAVAKKLAALKADQLRTDFEKAEINLLIAKRYIALKDLNKASEYLNKASLADQAHVESKIVAGEYLLHPMQAGQRPDPEQARRMFDQARQISPDHVGAILGLAEAQLACAGKPADLDLSDEEVLRLLGRAREAYDKAAVTSAPWPREDLSKFDLLKGRLLTRLGRASEAASLLAGGADKFPERADDYQDALGHAHIRAGQYDQASVVFRDLTKKAPGSLKFRIQCARALLALGNPQEALKVLDGAKGAAARGNKELLITKGIVLYELRQKARARDALVSTATDGQSVPMEAGIYLSLIDAEADPEENLDRSLEYLRSIRSTSRWWPLARAVTGRLLLEKGDEAGARQALEEAARLDPLDYESPCALGRFVAETGRIGEAIPLLRQAAERNPFHDEAVLWLAEAQMMSGDFDAAAAALDSLIDKRGTASAMEAKVYLELSRGRMDAARSALTRLRKSFPASNETSVVSVIFLAMDGSTEQLQAEIKRLRKKGGTDTKAHLARRLRRLGMLDDARAIYDGFDKSETVTEAKVGLMEIGLAAADKKQRAAADKSLDALLKAALAKDNPLENPSLKARILAADSRRLADAKKKHQARKQAAAAIAASPFSPEARLALAICDLRWGKASDAAASLEMAIRLDPAMAEAYAELGLILSKTGGDAARAAYCLDTAAKLSPKAPFIPAVQKARSSLGSPAAGAAK